VEGRLPTLGGVAEPDLELDLGSDGASGGTPELPEITKDYLALNRRIRRAGLYETRDSYYIGKYLVLLALLSSAWVVAPEVPWLAGLLLGLFVQQSAFIGHDLGHNSVMTRTEGWLFNRKYKDLGTWAFANIGFGIDGIKWSTNHQGHHKVNLLYDKDPQNFHLPWLLYEAGEVDYYCDRGGKITPFNRWWLKHQHLLSLPVMLLIQKLNMIQKQRKLLKQGHYFRFFGVVIHLGLWVSLFLRSGYSPAFLLGGIVTAGIIHIQILLSHAYMPRFTEAEQHRLGWIRFQVLGTQNVTTTWYDDWFHGGLQYQLEHHLFEGVPRHNLKKIQPWVSEYCEKHQLPYRTDPFLVCIADMLKSFYRESRTVEVRM
jgi:delta8-fatty-acid desaturase